MSIVRVIGDVHGKLKEYADLTRTCDYSISLGEMGFGNYIQRLISMYTSGEIDGDKHIILPGNHDHYGVIESVSTFLTRPGYGIFLNGPLSDIKAFHVRGAASIDKEYRTPGSNWFPEEELTQSQLDDALSLYDAFRPDVMITHTAPDCLVDDLICGMPRFKFRTEQALQAMLDIHRPHLWIFGHFHVTERFQDENNKKTQFVALGELATCDLNTKNLSCEVCDSPFKR